MRSKPARPGRVTPGPQVARSQVDDGPDGAARVRDTEVTFAAFGYLGAIFLGPVIPLVIHATASKGRPLLCYHAARALNLTVTGLLYGLCCLILGGLLLLVSQSTSAIGTATTRATVRLSSRSRPPRIRQHSPYSKPVTVRFSARAA